MVFAADLRPPPALARHYRDQGLWRDQTPLSDLRRAVAERPDAPVIIGHRAKENRVDRLSYKDFSGHVQRFAAALRGLGVQRGEVVAFQLPNWWETAALYLACARAGAVAAPVMPTIRERELERVLACVQAVVCFTPDEWDGFGSAAAVAEMAPRLPALRHRVVLGDAAATAAVSFADLFLDQSRESEPADLDDEDDPDRVFLVLFTSGTTGEPKGILHSHNTIYSGNADFAERESLVRGGEVLVIPHALTHMAGSAFGLLLPLLVAGTTLYQDVWDGAVQRDLLAEAGATMLTGAPPFLFDVIAAQEAEPRDLSTLRRVISGGMPIPRQLVEEVPRVLGPPLGALWAMTEVGASVTTPPDAPADWACHSDGRPGRALEVQLRPDRAEEDPESDQPQAYRLHVRGAGLCLGSIGRDSGTVTTIAGQGDGWYDTGDLARSDGRGGIRLIGRAGDRIGGTFMIPVHDVESELLDHPAVAQVAVIGYPDPHLGELACAVVVADGPAPTLQELRAHLTARGMTEWYQPSRLKIVSALPRNHMGKVRKNLLRDWLRGVPGWEPA